MPAFVVIESAYRIGQPVDATMCDPNVVGGPDRRTDTPVKVELSERTLSVDGGKPRRIISRIGENGRSTLLVEGSTRSIADRERRRALARVDSLLHQLAMALRPMTAGSESPGLATEGLGLLYNWLNEERSSEGGSRHAP